MEKMREGARERRVVLMISGKKGRLKKPTHVLLIFHESL
jgi:hypothetical protein